MRHLPSNKHPDIIMQMKRSNALVIFCYSSGDSIIAMVYWFLLVIIHAQIICEIVASHRGMSNVHKYP